MIFLQFLKAFLIIYFSVLVACSQLDQKLIKSCTIYNINLEETRITSKDS